MRSVDNSEGSVKVYTIEKFEIANTQIDFPRYKRIEYFESPPVPHISVHTFESPADPFFIRQIAFRYPYPKSFKILDIQGQLLYSSDTGYAAIALVPDIAVGSQFVIQLETDQPVVDIRAQSFSFNRISYVIAYYWPKVSTIDGIQKRFVQ